MRWMFSAAAAVAMTGVANSTPVPGPTANSDFFFFENISGTYVITPLDNDDNAGLPVEDLKLVSVSAPAGVTAEIAGNAILVSGEDGGHHLTYVVEDADGNQAQGDIDIALFTFTCGPVECS